MVLEIKALRRLADSRAENTISGLNTELRFVSTRHPFWRFTATAPSFAGIGISVFWSHGFTQGFHGAFTHAESEVFGRDTKLPHF
jgi:hypothetical protein